MGLPEGDGRAVCNHFFDGAGGSRRGSPLPRTRATPGGLGRTAEDDLAIRNSHSSLRNPDFISWLAQPYRCAALLKERNATIGHRFAVTRWRMTQSGANSVSSVNRTAVDT